jgi:ABC-type transport system substrate-binding protein
MRTHPIGTGPFKFAEFKPNERITVTRNPDYWKKGRPYLDGIEYTIIPNRSTALLAFEAGKFDLTFPDEVLRRRYSAHALVLRRQILPSSIATEATDTNRLSSTGSTPRSVQAAQRRSRSRPDRGAARARQQLTPQPACRAGLLGWAVNIG